MHMRCNSIKKLLYFCWLYIYILAGNINSMPKLTHSDRGNPPTHLRGPCTLVATPTGKNCNANK